MPAGPIQQLTAEESLELVLTLAGRLQAAMGAPPEERENAQARTMDMLVWYWPTVKVTVTGGLVKLPSLLATALSSMFKYSTLSFNALDVADQSLREVIKSWFWDDNLDFSVHTAREGFWWRQVGENAAGPSGQAEGTAAAAPAQPSTKRKGPEDTEREKAAKRPRKAGKTVKSSAYVEDSDDVPLQSQTGEKADVGKTGPAEQPTAGPSGDKGKGVDRSGVPVPPFSCDYCRNRGLECRYHKGVVCGRCTGCHKGHGICTLNAKDMITGKPMKGPAAEKKAVAFRHFLEALRAEGKPTPTLAIWDPRRETFIADLETFDEQASVAHAELVAWVHARNQAIAARKNLPDYKGDREPRKGRGKGKKATQAAQKAEQAAEAEDGEGGVDGMTVQVQQAAPAVQPDAAPSAAAQENAVAKVITVDAPQQVPGTKVSEDAQVTGKGKEPERPDPAFAEANGGREAIPTAASAEKAGKPSTQAPPADALGLGLTGLSLQDLPKPDFDFVDYESPPRAAGSKSKGLYIEISDSEPGPSKSAAPGQSKGQQKPVASPPIEITDDETVAAKPAPRPPMSSKKPVPRPVFASKKPVGAKAAQAADSSDESEATGGKQVVSPTVIVRPPEGEAFWWVSDPIPPRIGTPSKPSARLANIISNIHWTMGALLDLKNADSEAIHQCRGNNEEILRLRMDTQQQTAALRTEIEQAFAEAQKVGGELDETNARVQREKTRRQQLVGRVEELSAALKAEQATNQELQRQLATEASARADQERRLAALEAKLQNLRVPDARAIRASAMEQMEQGLAMRLQAVTLSYESMGAAMQEREKQVDDMLRERADQAADFEARLAGMVQEQVRLALQAQMPKAESPEPGVTSTPRAASLAPSALREHTPQATPQALPPSRQPTPPEPSVAPPPLPREPTPATAPLAPPPTSSRPPTPVAPEPTPVAPAPTPVAPEPTTPRLPGTPVALAVPPPVSSTAPVESNLEGATEAAGNGKQVASPGHREASVTSLSSPLAKRARSIPPTIGYSGKADGGPSQKTWVSPAEQAKAKSKVVSHYSLRSRPVAPPEPEAPGSPSSASAASSGLSPVPDVEGDVEMTE